MRLLQSTFLHMEHLYMPMLVPYQALGGELLSNLWQDDEGQSHDRRDDRRLLVAGIHFLAKLPLIRALQNSWKKCFAEEHVGLRTEPLGIGRKHILTQQANKK